VSSRLRSEHRVLCLAARTGVDAEARAELLALLAGPLDWQLLWDQGHLHEVLPLVGRTFGELPATAGVPDDLLGQLERRRVATALWSGMLTDELLRVLAAFDGENVEALPVKGAVLGAVVYGDPSLRPAVDLDVLVQERDLAAARRILGALGFEQHEDPTFAAHSHAFHDPGFLRCVDGQTVRLELHRSLWGAEQFRPHRDVFAVAANGVLGGVPVRILSAEDMLIHQVVHRARSPLRLRFLCDVAEVLRRYETSLDWGLVVRLASDIRARTALSIALTLAARYLGAPEPPGIEELMRTAPAKRALLARTCGARAMFRPAPPGDLEQQPHLVLRTLEQDGAGRIALNIGRMVRRKGQRLAYERRHGVPV
jgi:hypothetical protein